jgi:diaminohydroxyphosphoribosylaminopyrimidine deaminase/5-amino-6-(5-phosphoribosylamino)uracil reductase
VRSLLLEGGPTLATSFLAADLVDKVALFVAPTLSGAGPVAFGPLAEARTLRHVSAERVGEDVLLTGYLREP